MSESTHTPLDAYTPDGQIATFTRILYAQDGESTEAFTRRMALLSERLSTIETGYGYRSTMEYFFLSPDWGTLYVSRIKRNFTPVEQDPPVEGLPAQLRPEVDAKPQRSGLGRVGHHRQRPAEAQDREREDPARRASRPCLHFAPVLLGSSAGFT